MSTLITTAIVAGNLVITLGFLFLMGRPLVDPAGLQPAVDDRLNVKGFPVIVFGIALTCSPLFFATNF